jgi:transcriptional regulator with XRE-family HTH domain
MDDGFDLAAVLRRVRRVADLSQRELATAAELSVSIVAHAEAGTRDLPVRALLRVVALAGFRLAVVDHDGRQVQGMADGAVRDMAGRRFPAHLDTHHSDERWWRYEHRYDRGRPWYTFDRDREGRDALRRLAGTPDDHHLPAPGNSPHERKAQRQRDAKLRSEEERQRRMAAGGTRLPEEQFQCTCPPACDDLDEQTGELVHAQECPCHCDLA